MNKANGTLRLSTQREAYRQMISQPPILASKGWHCFVTVFCLLMCIGFLKVGLSGLEFLGDQRFVVGKTAYPIPHGHLLGLVGLVVLSARGCEFCLRELWRSAVASRRECARGARSN
jgi:hypothetical protein